MSDFPASRGGRGMLILRRKAGQAIMIGDEIEVVVHQVDEVTVEIGIKAPQDVPIKRAEILSGKGNPRRRSDRSGRSAREAGREGTRAIPGSARFREGRSQKRRRRVIIDPELRQESIERTQEQSEAAKETGLEAQEAESDA